MCSSRSTLLSEVQGQPAPLVPRGRRANQVQPARPERKGLKVSRVLRDLQVKPARRDSREHRAPRVLKAKSARKDQPGRTVPKGHREFLDLRAPRE